MSRLRSNLAAAAVQPPMCLPAKAPGVLFRTPADCTRGLLRVEGFGPRVWEPACGDGAIAEVLREAGHDVLATDLHDQGYGQPGRDFLAEPARYDAIPAVTNPPYAIAEEFARHAMAIGVSKLCMFLRLAFLESEARGAGLFAELPPARVWVMSKRRTLWRADDPNARSSGGQVAYAWFVWEAGFTGAPTLGWLP